MLIITLTSCSVVPDYKYTVKYSLCGTHKIKIITYIANWADTQPYINKDDKILYLSSFAKEPHSIRNVCTLEVKAEKVSNSLFTPDLNAKF